MDQNLRELAHRVLTKEDYDCFCEYAHKWSSPGGALFIAKEALDHATNEVLRTVYRDECDFVIMAHYRMAKDLYDLVYAKTQPNDSGS